MSSTPTTPARRRCGRAIALLLCASLTAPYAGAQETASSTPLSESLSGSARIAYEAGRILYADGDYAAAIVKFERAYQESRDPRLLWNQAAAEKNRRRYSRVAELVERYLAESGDSLSAEDRAQAQAVLATVAAFITDVTFKVVPDGAAIFVDDRQVGTSPMPKPLRLDMGERKIRAEKAGYLPLSSSHVFEGGSNATVEISLQRVVHEGQLIVNAGARDVIRVDGRVVGTGIWRATLESGAHRVEVSAPGKRTYATQVVVSDNQVDTLRVVLEPLPVAPAPLPPKRDESGNGSWIWVGAGVLLAAGLGAGVYFLTTRDDR